MGQVQGEDLGPFLSVLVDAPMHMPSQRIVMNLSVSATTLIKEAPAR